jgi:hypothetical protein
MIPREVKRLIIPTIKHMNCHAGLDKPAPCLDTGASSPIQDFNIHREFSCLGVTLRRHESMSQQFLSGDHPPLAPPIKGGESLYSLPLWEGLREGETCFRVNDGFEIFFCCQRNNIRQEKGYRL